MAKIATGSRKQKSAREARMVILENVPSSYNWGWYSREDARMHLQPVDRKHGNMPYKVWLERDGSRVIEPELGFPAKIWRPLYSRVLEQRGMIERNWVGFMMENGWLEMQVVHPLVILVAYPRFPHRFVRTLDLRDYIGDPETLAKITPDDVGFNAEYALLEVFRKRIIERRHHIRLEPILWT